MFQLYFSHSYRDVEINDYFIRLFADQGLVLIADQKSPTWCVPKLERYMTYADGFVAVVPHRAKPDKDFPFHFSKWIAAEIRLARRAGLPIRVFVEDHILEEFEQSGVAPGAALPFTRLALPRDAAEHGREVVQFAQAVQATAGRRPPRVGLRRACVFLAEESEKDGTSQLVARALKQQAYQPLLIAPPRINDCGNDLSAIDSLMAAELSVFCLEPQITRVDLALAIAHALCRPAFRLRRAVSPLLDEDNVYGLLPWQTHDQLGLVFEQQLESYSRGFCEKVPSGTAAGEKELVLPDWDPKEKASLVNYVQVGDPKLREDVNAVRRLFDTGFPALVADGRYDDLVRAAYQQVQQHYWVYDFEPASKDYSRQRIRTPRDIHQDVAATCLDLACLFAAMLESMQANPVILRVTWWNDGGGAHALAGCWVRRQRPGRTLLADKEHVLCALRQGDLLLLETTGAVRHRTRIAAEERNDGFLTYDQAKAKALELLERDDVYLDFLLDVLAGREP
jgi:hypothetical protein